MRDIARDADVTVASIYHHFPSKQLLLHDIMGRVLNDSIATTRSALQQAEARPDDQLAAIVRAWIRFHTLRRAEAHISASELRSLDDEGYALVVGLRDEQELMFREVVERGADEGVFATQFPREAARAILNMGSNVAAWYREGGELSPDEFAERYAALALGTVGSSAQSGAIGS